MRTDSVKKYVIPNIPYLFILWACLKLGTAYRLAPGSGLCSQADGPGPDASARPLPTLRRGSHPLDWLIGIVGAVGFRLLIYFKSKNAKKFRRDEEYGSARWGTEKDIKPFIDPKFENNVILTKTEFLTMNTRPKNPANARNLNCLHHRLVRLGQNPLLAHARSFCRPARINTADAAMWCVDPKGGVLGQVGCFPATPRDTRSRCSTA